MISRIGGKKKGNVLFEKSGNIAIHRLLSDTSTEVMACGWCEGMY
jgi:hypothetical protein